MNAVLCRISVLFVVIYFDQSIWVTVIITTNTTHILIYNRCRLFLLFRNSGIGVVSLASDVGGTCSPFVVQMTRVNAILPFAFTGGLSFIAALFCWFLPETLGKSTPEVLEDTEVKQGIHIRP